MGSAARAVRTMRARRIPPPANKRGESAPAKMRLTAAEGPDFHGSLLKRRDVEEIDGRVADFKCNAPFCILFHSHVAEETSNRFIHACV